MLDALDEAELVETLVELVRVPSVTGTAAESELQPRWRRWFDEAGLEVDPWPLDLDELRTDPDFPGTEAPRVEGRGVVGTTSGEGSRGWCSRARRRRPARRPRQLAWWAAVLGAHRATACCTGAGPAT